MMCKKYKINNCLLGVTKKWLLFFTLGGFWCFVSAQAQILLKVEIDTTFTFQTIHNFAASDAWAAQYVGNWPDEKKNAIADLLFSMDIKKDGSPTGIGLSAWRFNIGAGSASQGEKSGIKDPWRRTEGFLQDDHSFDWRKQSGQQWFLQAAKKRGVDYFIAFANSPPIQLTKNHKAHSRDGLSANLSEDLYFAYASFLTKVLQYFKDALCIYFDYISPFNEPQWEWKGGQEGSPWNNDELAKMTRVLDSVFNSEAIDSQIEITEAGELDYLTGQKEKFGNRSNQIEVFFNTESPHYIADLKSLAPKIAAHSYFTTWNMERLIMERYRISKKLINYPSLEYWMSEYCILENNEEITGKGKDTDMRTALYMARVIHADLTISNASAWHWWTAMSPYDYKDGLIYHDKEIYDGNFSDSKLLWALGNFSRFIRPEAKRINVNYTNYNQEVTLKDGVLISAFKNMDQSLVIVAINQKKKEIDLNLSGLALSDYNQDIYITDENHDLQRIPRTIKNDNIVTVAAASVTTLLLKVE